MVETRPRPMILPGKMWGTPWGFGAPKKFLPPF